MKLEITCVSLQVKLANDYIPRGALQNCLTALRVKDKSFCTAMKPRNEDGVDQHIMTKLFFYAEQNIGATLGYKEVCASCKIIDTHTERERRLDVILSKSTGSLQ